MNTRTTAAVLMMLAVLSWADVQTESEAYDPANTNEPIVLSDTAMDNVTAGYVGVFAHEYQHLYSDTSSSTSTSGENSLYGDFLGLDDIWTEG